MNAPVALARFGLAGPEWRDLREILLVAMTHAVRHQQGAVARQELIDYGVRLMFSHIPPAVAALILRNACSSDPEQARQVHVVVADTVMECIEILREPPTPSIPV